MKTALKGLLLLVLLFGFGAVGATPFTFQWTGLVELIEDGNLPPNPITPTGISVGDTMVATLTSDTAGFGSGVAVTADGLDYTAPVGLEMIFEFSSGGTYSRGITYARARDASIPSSFDQWSWGLDNGSSIIMQDSSGGSFVAPLPVSFDEMLSKFIDNFSSFAADDYLNLTEPSPASDDEGSVKFK